MNERRVHEPFVFAAIGIGLTACFGYAAIVVAALAFRWQLGTWWIALVQAHGHAQLFGWTGLFVLGVGLFFLPRLRGTTLAWPRLAPWALSSLVGGITLRALSQPLLAFSQPSMPQHPLNEALGRSGLMLSGALELVSVALILTMLAASFRRARPMTPSALSSPCCRT